MEELSLLLGAGPSGVLAVFAYFALDEIRQMRKEISCLASGVYELIGRRIDEAKK